LLDATFTPSQDDAVSALTGFSLDHVLSDLSIPSTGLSNKLGISGIPTLSSSQIYNEKWGGDDGAVGAGEGEDFEDEVDRELKEEEEEEEPLKMESTSPVAPFKQRRVRVIRRLVERPKTVYERFPSFEKNKVLDFTELFQGFAVTKSRVVKRPIQCVCFCIRSWLADIGL
jgi:transcription initiation factor TFIID subunit 1